MSTPTLIKQPSESRLYTMDFAANCAVGETISSVTSFAADTPTGATALTVGGASCSGTTASARISGGTDGKQYKVTVLVLTSAGNTLEGEGILQVRDL